MPVLPPTREQKGGGGSILQSVLHAIKDLSLFIYNLSVLAFSEAGDSGTSKDYNIYIYSIIVHYHASNMAEIFSDSTLGDPQTPSLSHPDIQNPGFYYICNMYIYI